MTSSLAQFIYFIRFEAFFNYGRLSLVLNNKIINLDDVIWIMKYKELPRKQLYHIDEDPHNYKVNNIKSNIFKDHEGFEEYVIEELSNNEVPWKENL
jgi:hypothetical protein